MQTLNTSHGVALKDRVSPNPSPGLLPRDCPEMPTTNRGWGGRVSRGLFGGIHPLFFWGRVSRCPGKAVHHTYTSARARGASRERVAAGIGRALAGSADTLRPARHHPNHNKSASLPGRVFFFFFS